MDYIISEKMKGLKPSAIREIFKYAADPAVISLAGGNPAPETLPVNDLKRLMAEILETDPMTALLYSQSEGYPPLRDAVKKWLREKYGVFKEFDDLMIVSGAQQCMDLTTKVLCNEGDTVICEEPSFIGSLNAFRSYNVKLAGVPVSDDGIDLEALQNAVRTSKNPRFIYLIPNFQNPTGITMSLEKRKAVLAIAKKHSIMILEDNPYGDLRFRGEEIPAIKSFDDEGHVIYAGTFSKILSTGIRAGYLVAPSAIMPKLVVAKQCADVHTGMLQQLLCFKYLMECDVAAHIEAGKKVYARKCSLMLECMDNLFPKSVSYTRPDGGLFIWATMPPEYDGAEFALELVRDYKVCVVPGTAFLSGDGGNSSSFRLNFSSSSEDQIRKGIQACAELLRKKGLA